MKFLRDLLTAAGGRLTVEQFMAAALYHPEFGYYSRQIKTVGRRGDFSTAATLHPLLARAVAKWIGEYRGDLRHIIEIGPGTGEMAAAVRKFLPWLTRRRCRFHLVETSPVLRATQEKLLSGGDVRWHETMREALAACAGRALIYANELVDAFPCVQAARAGDRWEEVFLELVGEEARERSGAFISAIDPANFSALARPENAPPGQRRELHDSYRRWLTDWTPAWQEGAMLTIDYGDVATELYKRRPRGTLRAYFQHTVHEGPAVYQRVGRQDLTADVNFTDLENWGRRQGLRAAFFQTQAEFISRRLTPSGTAAEQMLLPPAGAGAAFKVLCQTKGDAYSRT